MLEKYQSFLERTIYNVNVSTGQSDYDFIKRNKYRFNRLKHLVYQMEQEGSPLEGEKISEILLGATNLNYLDLSYPFVDLKVIYPIKGVTKNGELISVKTSRDENTLRDSVTYVNGFKIGQLIQFGVNKIGMKLYKSGIFKGRYAIKLSSIISFYNEFISEMFKDNMQIYTYAFMNSISIFEFIKRYLDRLNPEEDKNKLFIIIASAVSVIVDMKYGTDYKSKISETGLIKNSGKYSEYLNLTLDNLTKFTKLSKYDFTAENVNLPSEIKSLQISYCILFFDKDEPNKPIVLNLYKTQALSFEELFKNSMKIWVDKGYHIQHMLGDIKKKKIVGRQNLYLNYDGVIKAFSGGPNNLQGEDVFETQIRVEISAEWEYKEREEKVKQLYVKVIDKIKGIENNEKQVQILKLINKFLNKVHSKKGQQYLDSFAQMFKDQKSIQ